MSRIFYHTAVIENALGDIGRGSGTGRSTAEIALTRLCDAKTAATAEAMLVRIEELEKQVAMLKLGVPSTPSPTASAAAEEPVAPTPTAEKPKEPTRTSPTLTESAPPTVTPAAGQPQPYRKWSRVIERIGEIKRPLSVQFIGAAAYTADARSFTVEMSSFFAKKLLASEGDMAILKGILAELEGCDAASIHLDIQEKRASGGQLFGELERSLTE